MKKQRGPQLPTSYPYGQRAIGAQNGVDDYSSMGANDEQEILKTMNERADEKMGAMKGHAEKARYGSRSGPDNRKAHDRGAPEDFVSKQQSGSTPDDSKLNKQQMPNDRMYSYLQ